MESTVEYPNRYSATSTFMDLQKTKRGQEFLQLFMSNMSFPLQGIDSDEEDELLGEDGAEMKQAMINEMPLIALASFGMITIEQINELIIGLNQ